MMFIILPTPEGALQNGYHATLGMSLSLLMRKNTKFLSSCKKITMFFQ